MTESVASFSPPVLLTKAHDCASFDSGESVLDDWLRNRALENIRLRASRSYVICPAGSLCVVGYFAMSMAHILGLETTGAIRRNMPKQIPAVLLGRLAIDRSWQSKGLGRALLADAVRRTLRASEETPARLLLVHALSPAAEAFYLHHGFKKLPTQTSTLALDLLKYQTLE